MPQHSRNTTVISRSSSKGRPSRSVRSSSSLSSERLSPAPARKSVSAPSRKNSRTPSWYDPNEAAETSRLSARDNRAQDSEDEAAAPRSARELKRRARSKERAGKMFERQFGDGSAAPGEGSPRAAVYKGKMGPNQRKAQRMQGSTPSGSVASAVLSAPGAAAGTVAEVAASAAREGATKIAKHTSITPLSLKIITAIICVVFACVFLYTPAQQYYQAQREHDRLSAEYASIEARNDALNVQNDILASEAGIEDSVRQKFGYTRPDEDTAIVTGLSEETTDSLRDSEHIEANVLSSSVKAPEEWYTPILDALFGVE